ncbi:MAG: integrase core domain-containing protein [Patescibacteria group bacterium]
MVLSASDPGSPWQNGFMESWFGKFKDDLGPLTPYSTAAQLHEALALQIHYYNHDRIHTALKMSPVTYAAQHKKDPARMLGVSDKVLQKVGA